jgi:tetratricopeptide (TPR) repeat protein
VLLALMLIACTPQQMLLSALVPDGTASVMLGNLQGIADANRRQIAMLEQRGDWPGLAAFAEQNMARDSFSPEWRLVAGYAASRAGDHRAAAVHYGEMLRLAPDDPAAYRLLAGAQRDGGDPGRAARTLEQGLLAGGESALTLSLLGDVRAELGELEAALSAYRRALTLSPRLEPAWWGQGRLALRMGRVEEARRAAALLRDMHSPRAEELERLIAGAR